MAEILSIVVLTAAGFGVLAPAAATIPRLALGAMAFPMGAVVYAAAASIQLVAIDRIEPVSALVMTGCAGILGLLVGFRMGTVRRPVLATGAITVTVAAGLAIVFWVIPLTRLTIDSMRYLISAFDLQAADGVTQVQPADLLKRQVGLPSWQAIASLTERRYVAGVGPLFGISGTVLLGWLAWTVSAAHRHRRLLTIGAVAFALASNRFLYDWFYINTHVAMAVLVLIAVAGLWLATSREEWGWSLPAGIALAGTLLLRAESPLLVALVLVAFAPEAKDRTTRLLASVPSIVIGVVWYGFTLWSHASGGSDIAFDAPVFMGLIAIVGSAGLMLIPERVAWLGDVARLALIPVLALTVIVASVVEPATTIDSIVATAQNVGYQGLWMFTWSIGVPLLVVALVVQRFPGGRAWTTVVVGYGLLFFVLPHLRESPWRLGSGDSGNRILAHILLVVVMYLVLAATDSGEHESPSRSTPGPTARR